MDEGYIGVQRQIRGILPKHKTQRRYLSATEQESNDKHDADRVIVKNFSVRRCVRWDIVGNMFRWIEQVYDTIFKMSVAATKFHIEFHPLRKAKASMYSAARNRFYSIGDEVDRNKEAISKIPLEEKDTTDH